MLSFEIIIYILQFCDTLTKYYVEKFILKNPISFKKCISVRLSENNANTYIIRTLPTNFLTIFQKKIRNNNKTAYNTIENLVNTKAIYWNDLKVLNISANKLVQKLIIGKKWKHVTIERVNQIIFKHKINLKYLKCELVCNEHLNLQQLLQIENLDIKFHDENDIFVSNYIQLNKQRSTIKYIRVSRNTPNKILQDILKLELPIECLRFGSELTYRNINSEFKQYFKKFGNNIRGVIIEHDDTENIDEYIVDGVLNYSPIIMDMFGRTNLEMVGIRGYIKNDISIDFRELKELKCLISKCESQNINILYGNTISKLELNTKTTPYPLEKITELALFCQYHMKPNIFIDENNIQKLTLKDWNLKLTHSYEYLKLTRATIYACDTDTFYIKKLILSGSKILSKCTLIIEHLELDDVNQYCDNLIAKNITIWIDGYGYECVLNLNNLELDTLTLKTNGSYPSFLYQKTVLDINCKVNIIRVENGIKLSDNAKQKANLVINDFSNN